MCALAHQPLTVGAVTVGAEQGRSEYRESDCPAKAASLDEWVDALWSKHDSYLRESI